MHYRVIWAVRSQDALRPVRTERVGSGGGQPGCTSRGHRPSEWCGVPAGDRGQQDAAVRIHSEAAEREELPAAGHQPRRPPQAASRAPPQLQQAQAQATDLRAAGGDGGGGAGDAAVSRALRADLPGVRALPALCRSARYRTEGRRSDRRAIREPRSAPRAAQPVKRLSHRFLYSSGLRFYDETELSLGHVIYFNIVANVC